MNRALHLTNDACHRDHRALKVIMGSYHFDTQKVRPVLPHLTSGESYLTAGGISNNIRFSLYKYFVVFTILVMLSLAFPELTNITTPFY